MCVLQTHDWYYLAKFLLFEFRAKYVLEICQADTTNEHESEANLISPCMANVIFFQKENILTPSASRVNSY